MKTRIIIDPSNTPPYPRTSKPCRNRVTPSPWKGLILANSKQISTVRHFLTGRNVRKWSLNFSSSTRLFPFDAPPTGSTGRERHVEWSGPSSLNISTVWSLGYFSWTWSAPGFIRGGTGPGELCPSWPSVRLAAMSPSDHPRSLNLSRLLGKMSRSFVQGSSKQRPKSHLRGCHWNEARWPRGRGAFTGPVSRLAPER